MKSIRLLGILVILLALMPLTLSGQQLPGPSVFSLARSSESGITLHFELPEWKLDTVERDGQTLQRISIEGANYLFIDDTETLPVFATLVAIPYSGGASLNLLGSQEQNRGQMRLDFDAALSKERAQNRYLAPLYPADQVLISEPQLLRDFRVVSLNVHPFQYDQAKGELIVSQSMDIRLDFNSLASINEMEPPQYYSSSFERIYSGLIINYSEFLARESSYTSPRILVIYGNYSDATYLAKVNEYVNWKRQKCYIVNAVSTATAGTSYTAIKNYIQNQYNNINTRPDYVTIIGDDSGTIAVPTYGTYMDYYYTWLAGGDNLGDIIIGRISVNTTDHMIDYMNKVASVEQNINLNTAQWLNKMVLVGDSASSGISTIYTNRYIRDHSYAINPNYTYTELYGSSPSPSAVNTAINAGVLFYNYRGYIGMSGWPSYISSLSNTYKLFHGVFITCNTGSWGGGTSTTETVVRYRDTSGLSGALTCIGMATSSTHTPMNNCLDVGIFHGLYPLGMRDMGEAMLYGKLYLYAVYGVSNATLAYNFSGYCNLIGDPTATVYVDIPSTFSVVSPTVVPAGSSSMSVSVFDQNSDPVEGAAVTLTNSSGLQIVGFTDDQGAVLMEYSNSLTGNLTLTASKDDFKPFSRTVSISSAGGAVYDDMILDDDNSGQSSGNENAEANPGETIELFVSLLNTTTSTMLLSANASCSDPWVVNVDFDRIEYNSIAPGGTGLNDNPVVFQIAEGCPDGHVILINWEVESNSGTWTVPVAITVQSGRLVMQAWNFQGSTGNIVNPGDQYPLILTLNNTGSMGLSGVNAILRSQDMFFTIPDSLGFFGNIAQGATATNSGDSFTIYARSTCIDGMVIPLELYLYNNLGFTQSIPLTLTIGQTTVTDPLGQDAYGYFIFDMGDTAYDQCPTYQWIGIAPAEGGSGTALSLTDPGSSYDDEGDQVGAVAIQTVNLPFTFKYYGVNYTQASISSNGFIAFGATQDADWRNWRLPDAGGPSPMIAVFWDDLDIVNGTSYVYTYYNSAQHFYVVEWYHMISGYDSSTQQTFQAILYDPVYYPTHTGDGQIKLQYKDFNNIDLGDGDPYPHGNFCTIGIEDHTETVGLEYTYNNAYPTAAAPLSDEKALFITTRPLIPDYPYVAVEQVYVIDPNSNSYLEPGEASDLSIRLGNRGLVDATNVAAVLSSTDPYVIITTANAFYGTIAAQGNAYPQSNYAISVAPSCPADHEILFTLNISSATGNWTYNFTLTVVLPELGFSNMLVNDIGGNQNGVLDPGESASVTIHLDNTGLIPLPAGGTASLSCSTPGITILTGTDSFSVIAAGAYEVLNFSISAAAGMTEGTLIYLNFDAVSGATSATASYSVEVGAPLEVVIGSGTNTQSYPLDRYYNYSAHEAIYLASEIGMAGTFKSFAFFKASGGDTSAIDAVSIYMKHTTASSIATGNYSTSGYTLVYSGTYPNTSASGWMEVNLSPMFVYDGVSNLSVLTVKGYQQWINNYPFWTYSSTANNRARQNRSDSGAPTNLLATTNLPNLRLKIFPSYDLLLPPQNLTATASHQSVQLAWSAPASGTPTGYKIYRNAALLTTVTTLSYTDLAVTNGSTYTYYLKAVYPDGDSDPTAAVSATPNMHAPTNLTAVAGFSLVNLNWTAALGREFLPLAASDGRSISGYKIYRDAQLLTTVTGTSYQDTGLANGITYSYYVTTLYADPAGESEPSNTASATPTASTFVVLGTGTSVNNGNQNAPINISDRSVHGQSVYTAAELNAAGITGPAQLTQLGFNVVGAPIYNLVNFVVRLKHTTATNAAEWHTADNLVTCYSNPSYAPNAGGYDMLQFSTPFQWNGVDNILVDTAFGLIQQDAYSGLQQYTSANSGYRFTYNDFADQTNVFTGGLVVGRRYNVRLGFQPISAGPDITVDPLSLAFGNIVVGSSSVQQFNIQNTGDEVLAGSITTPAGYTVALATRNNTPGRDSSSSERVDRNTLAFSVPAGTSRDFSLSFAPSAVGTFNGNVTIASNDSGNPTIYLAVTGSGYIPPEIVLDNDSIGAMLDYGEADTDSFVISNTGGMALNFTIAETPEVPWLNVTPSSGTIPAGGNQVIEGYFTSGTMVPGTYQTTLQISSNDPDYPLLEVNVLLVVNNSAPTINLPDSFAFDMGGTLQVDFTPYVHDDNGQALLLDYSGNTNVLVNVSGLLVTFSAVEGWFGTENITFTVSDAMDETSDTVPVTVNLGSLEIPEIGAVVSGPDGAGVSWQPVPNATAYEIYRSDDPYGTYVLIATVTDTSYLDTAMLDKAFYRVVAVNQPPVRPSK